MNKYEIKSEISDINKEIKREQIIILEQNKKIIEIEDKIQQVNDKSKITEKYVSGFSSFFGFFPKLFSSSTKKENIIKSEEVQISNTENNTYSKNQEYISKNKNREFHDDFEEEIYDLQKNAKNLKIEIDLNMRAIEDLDRKFDKTNKNMNNLLKETKKVEKQK